MLPRLITSEEGDQVQAASAQKQFTSHHKTPENTTAHGAKMGVHLAAFDQTRSLGTHTVNPKITKADSRSERRSVKK